MNETDTTPFPYDRISPELGKFMNVRFRWIADIGECLLNTESSRSVRGNDRQLTTQSRRSVY